MLKNDETIKSILKTVRRIEDHQASMDRDLEVDRQDLQNLSIKLGEVVEQMDQLRRSVNLMAERTRDRVAEAVEPVIDSTDRLTTQIQRKKMVVLKEPKKWWNKILGR